MSLARFDSYAKVSYEYAITKRTASEPSEKTPTNSFMVQLVRMRCIRLYPASRNQWLTDVLQTVREQRDSYIIETFDRSQAALVNLEEYRQFQRFRREWEAFFEWLEDTAARNADQNRGLSDEEVLAIIEDQLNLDAGK